MGRVIEIMRENDNQPGHWDVTIDRGEADPTMLTCTNRPAVSFGEDMIRIADVEFERWMPRTGIVGIDVQMSSKKTLLALVDQFEPERLEAYAKSLRASSDDQDDFQVAGMLQLLVEQYRAVGGFIGVDKNA